MNIRPVTPGDSVRILDIYSYYILNSTISFEEEVPSAEEFQRRIEEISSQYPFIVAASGVEITGYAYATKFRNRRAYRWATEVALYVDVRHQQKGIGKKLLGALLDILQKLWYYTAYAVITLPNEPSTKLFESFGFKNTVSLKQVGYKHGKWCDVDIMEKILRERDETPEEPLAFQEFITANEDFNLYIHLPFR